ncbi:putative CRM domain-containing protein, chloroplastic [Glycine max]|nr:putative CRM domain-containing protein, chloroplastic [Glycine max]
MISPNLEVRIRYKLEKLLYLASIILASNNGMDIVLVFTKLMCFPFSLMYGHWNNQNVATYKFSFILTYNSKGQAKGNLELRKFDVAKSPPETIIVYHGKNYVEPEVMPPPNTLSKVKALEKYRYEQSLEHTSQFIERLEKGLEEYHQHLAKFKNGKNDIAKDVNLAGMLLLKKVKLLIWSL